MSEPPLGNSALTEASPHIRRTTPLWPEIAWLIRLPHQSGTLLLMLPTLWSLVLASRGRPEPGLFAIFMLGAFLMRSAGVAMNDLADRSFDQHVTRTRSRPLARGTIRVPEAMIVIMVLLAIAALLLVFLNPFTILLSPGAVLLAALYPFSKRILHIPQIILGVAFGWGVLMAWAAVQNTLPSPVWLLYAATVSWAIAYDSIYALQDRDDDVRIGVKSSAVLFGTHTWIAVGISLLLMLILLGAAGHEVGLNTAFYGILAGVGGFLSQQVWKLRRAVPSADALRMFKQHVWVGWALLAGIWLGFL